MFLIFNVVNCKIINPFGSVNGYIILSVRLWIILTLLFNESNVILILYGVNNSFILAIYVELL